MTLAPQRIEQHEGNFTIDWNDSHRSEYSLQWLTGRSLPGTGLSECAHDEAPDDKVASSRAVGATTRDVLTDEGCLKRALATLYQTGWVVLTAPEGGEECPPIAFEGLMRRIGGFVQPSYFGDYFDLSDQPLDETDSISFSARALPLHTDLPYYSTPPDFQFLYGLDVDADCAALGVGQTRFVDGQAVVKELQLLHPQAFDTLCTTPVTYRATYLHSGKIYESVTPIIRFSEPRDLVRIVNNPSKMFFDNIPPDQFRAFFRAYKLFRTLLTGGSSSYTHSWRTGDLVIWDNRRIFHGRDDFEGAGRKRLLRGGYFSDVELSARLRFLDRSDRVQAISVAASASAANPD